MRAAIYARFSSDLQRDTSIADQLALCRELAAREGFAVVASFEDRAVSGSSIVNRRGFQALMQAARAKEFDLLLAEDVDRISRDEADWHALRRDLEFLGIAIHTATGKVTRIDGSLRALMGAMYIENLRLHVHRGLEGVVRDGRSAGGRAYGYRPVPGRPGELAIAPAEAKVVRKIFRDYIAGKTPREIAHALNRANVPAPRGQQWNASTINGSRQRGTGILFNQLYAGRTVWNKVRMVKDPATGKRISRPNPVAEHRTVAAPQLRLIDDVTFAKARERKEQLAVNAGAARPARRPRAFSGLMRCAACGGSLTSIGRHKGVERIQCSNVRENGTCSNSRRIKRAEVERLALAALKRELTAPDLLQVFVKTYNAERARLRRLADGRRASLERRLGEARREMARGVDAIIKQGADASIIAPQLNALKAEIGEIEARLDAADHRSPLQLHPAAIARYRADVLSLEALGDDVEGMNAGVQASLRRLVVAIVVDAPPHSQAISIEVKGRLAELLDLRKLSLRSGEGGPLVAGEGVTRSPLTDGAAFSLYAARA